jgi:hypothetical protein
MPVDVKEDRPVHRTSKIEFYVYEHNEIESYECKQTAKAVRKAVGLNLFRFME